MLTLVYPQCRQAGTLGVLPHRLSASSHMNGSASVPCKKLPTLGLYMRCSLCQEHCPLILFSILQVSLWMPAGQPCPPGLAGFPGYIHSAYFPITEMHTPGGLTLEFILCVSRWPLSYVESGMGKQPRPGTQEAFSKRLCHRGMRKGSRSSIRFLRTRTSAPQTDRVREGLRALKTLIFFSPGHCWAPGSENAAQLASPSQESLRLPSQGFHQMCVCVCVGVAPILWMKLRLRG